MASARRWMVELREEKFGTQEELAKSVGISRNYVSELESGTKDPSVPMAKKLASVLGCDWTLFYADEVRESKHTA